MEIQALPPCQTSCPIHQDIREYINLIARGEFNKALEVIRKTNPLPASCGYICAHYCQDECRRSDLDGSLSIKALKRFAEEHGDIAINPQQTKAKKVAVIGAGPAGLAAAQYLVRRGYGVTVFERGKLAGGALRNYIPLYRLPHEALDRDIAALEKEGVKLEFGQEMGKDFTPQKLLDSGYSSVLLSLGLPQSKKLDIPGANHKKVLLALPFLHNVKYNSFRFHGEKVIVIGGGNVAIDVARSAKRCGAKSVKLCCLESREKMPAFPWEIEAAVEEGVELFCSEGPKAIICAENKILGLETKKCLAVFDAQGCFKPLFDEKKLNYIEGDVVIFAIGQCEEKTPLQKSNIPLDHRGRIRVDERSMLTTIEGVFACGEIVEGPQTAVKAIASGQKAARAIDSYLQGKEILFGTEENPLPRIPETVIEKIKPIARVEVPVIKPEQRVDSFGPVEFSYTLLQALQESRRCLRCGAGAVQSPEECIHCLTCVRTCPYDVPQINEKGLVELRHDLCQACGLCLTLCPACAITFQSKEVETAQRNISAALKKIASKSEGGPRLLIFTCAYAPFAMGFYNPELFDNKPQEVEIIKWSCISQIGSLDLLRAFEYGADSVLIVTCAENNALACPNFDTLMWTEKRIRHVQEILKEIGLPKERLALTSIDPFDKQTFNKIIKAKLDLTTPLLS
ncbi:MAG: FAD-dependent oxidoreductase [Dethiobacteria bacterium]|jgi:formate dehydrogenase beta subunit|nr:FAD-dependent oxidoreductase [Bacillota bacterium]